MVCSLKTARVGSSSRLTARTEGAREEVVESDSSGAEARFSWLLLSELKLRAPREWRNPRTTRRGGVWDNCSDPLRRRETQDPPSEGEGGAPGRSKVRPLHDPGTQAGVPVPLEKSVVCVPRRGG